MSKNLNDKIKILEQKVQNLVDSEVGSNSSQKKKPVKVEFDKSSSNPWFVIFSERGFLVNDTRLSFEEIDNALSKDYNIVLGGGKGLFLDAVKMQSILKYKDLF